MLKKLKPLPKAETRVHYKNYASSDPISAVHGGVVVALFLGFAIFLGGLLVYSYKVGNDQLTSFTGLLNKTIDKPPVQDITINPAPVFSPVVTPIEEDDKYVRPLDPSESSKP